MKYIKTIMVSNPVYEFNKDIPACATVSSDETFWVETLDCYSNCLHQDYIGVPVNLDGVNPITGPIYINGAKAGDTIAVDILDIETSNIGTIYLRPGAGVFGHLLTHSEISKIPIEGNKIELPGGICIPTSYMIGVIGTAPQTEKILSGIPGKHGGNIDTSLITSGSTLYLPVFVDGAFLSLGDLHAAMGDGESGNCGVEVAGRVKLRVRLLSDLQETWPVLENSTDWMVIASGQTLDEAVNEASLAMFTFIEKRTCLKSHDIVRFLTTVGNLNICQVVNPLKTVRMVISKSSLNLSFSKI